MTDIMVGNMNNWIEDVNAFMQSCVESGAYLRGRVDKLTTVGWDSQEDWK